MLHRTSRRESGSAEGAAAVEFAFIAPLLIMLFFGIVQIGILVYRAQVIEASAREAARVASVGNPADEVEDAAIAAATMFDPSVLTVDTTDLCDNSSDDTTVVVTASDADGSLDYEIPFVGSFSPTLSATATFRCERATS